METFLFKLERKHTSGEVQTPLVSKLGNPETVQRKLPVGKRLKFSRKLGTGEMQFHSQLQVVCEIDLQAWRNVTEPLLYIGLYCPACNESKL